MVNIHQPAIYSIRGIDSIQGAKVAVLTVRSLEDEVAKRLRVRAAENGRATEAEHRELLRSALIGECRQDARQQAAERLAEFRCQTAGRSAKSSADLLAESRDARTRSLAETDVEE